MSERERSMFDEWKSEATPLATKEHQRINGIEWDFARRIIFLCDQVDKLELALAHYKAALSYAYEDTGDMYYLNVKEKIEEILK